MNLAAGIGASAARSPDKAALLIESGCVTYRELDARIDAAAAGFQAAGLEPGDRVALFVKNSVQFAEALYGALRAGLVVVPINVAYTADEVDYILRDCGARALVASDGHDAVLAGIREANPALDHVVVAGAAMPLSGTQTWREFLAGRPHDVQRGGDDLALLPYTSGTSGRPKGVMLSHANLRANHRQMEGTRLKLQAEDIVLCALPLFHIYALNVGLMFPLAGGATVLLHERFDPKVSLESVTEQGVTIIMGVPTMYAAWANVPDVGRVGLSSVRYAVSGAAPLPRRVLERFFEEFSVRVWEGYGLTETSPVLTSTAMNDAPRPGSVGRPVPEVELRLVDDRGHGVAPGDPGEVVVRGPNVFSGYWNDAEGTREVLDGDGWFATGDIGLLHEGDLFLADRKKDLVIVSGFNVYPREVEDVLLRHPKVADAAAVGMPHPRTGEAIKAVIVLEEGEETTAEEITDFCRRSLARFKCPEVVEFALQLPRDAAGKVLRRELR